MHMSREKVMASGTIAAAVGALLAAHGAQAQPVAVRALADLSLEQLSTIAVTSVSGRAESLQDAPASIFVITGEDIRRSAATSLPEALRLAPNLQVAQLNASQYSISARGFNNAIGNKLLVLIDGRTVYSPLFSGVFWDANDVMLEDVERIEVISGPGGTIWGANAVNGVINIITKPAAATEGTALSVVRSRQGGYESARIGGTLGENGHYRLYGLAMDHGNTSRADGLVRPDSAGKRQLGFRTDWELGGNRITLQGDAYEGSGAITNGLAPRQRGANLLARWSGKFSDGSPFTLQGYADSTRRDEGTTFRNQDNTLDLQFSHEPQLASGNKLLWGAGYRRTRDSNDTSAGFAFLPAARSLSWANVFAQYEHPLAQSLKLTVGAKAERNDYTGVEFLPSARLTWKHSPQEMTWASLSRAVRAPARLDREFFVPARAPFVIGGGPAFESEIANVLEIGHRGYAARGVTYSVAAFHQRYSKLRSGSAPPVTLVNQIEGSVNGAEGWAAWQATQAWRLSAGFLALRKNLVSTRGTPDPSGVASLGNDPRLQWSLRSNFDIGRNGEFDVTVRHVGSLPSPAVPAYTAVDGRFGWRIAPGVQASLLVQNLFDRQHVEFNDVGVASQIERRIFLKLAWQL